MSVNPDEWFNKNYKANLVPLLTSQTLRKFDQNASQQTFKKSLTKNASQKKKSVFGKEKILRVTKYGIEQE